MKKIFLIFVIMIFFANISFAQNMYSIIVNDKVVSSEIIIEKYNNDFLLPLKKISKELGYEIFFDTKTKEITVETSIQKVMLKNGSAKALIKGKLKVINVDNEFELNSNVIIKNNTCYVSYKLFEELFNTVEIEGKKIIINTLKNEITTQRYS